MWQGVGLFFTPLPATRRARGLGRGPKVCVRPLCTVPNYVESGLFVCAAALWEAAGLLSRLYIITGF